MDQKPGVPRPVSNLLPTEVEGVDSLAELALDRFPQSARRAIIGRA